MDAGQVPKEHTFFSVEIDTREIGPADKELIVMYRDPMNLGVELASAVVVGP